MEKFLAILFLGYFTYAAYIAYCLMAMRFHIVVSFCIYRRQIWKITIMTFLTEGIVLIIAELIHDVIKGFINYKTLSVSNIFSYDSFKFEIFYILITTSILLLVGFFVYRSIEGKMNLRKLASLIGDYSINILIMLCIVFRYGITLGGV